MNRENELTMEIILKKNLKQTSIRCITILLLFTSCTSHDNSKNNNVIEQAAVQTTINFLDFKANVVTELAKDIRTILQDKNGNYWFAGNGNGVYCYNGKTLIQFTSKDGLPGNIVWAIQEDKTGNLWFSTSNGLCRFNGSLFTNFTDALNNASQVNLHHEKGNLFFSREGNVYNFDGKLFTNFPIHPAGYKPGPSNLDRPYGVYCTLEDKAGNLWFGTDEKGVCRYDGKSFTYFTEKGLDGGAVRSIFQDKNGNLWFGNNGYGLFCYDGKTLKNFTEEKGLGNPAFLKKTKMPGDSKNLARVWSINEDNDGNLWIGTIDAGVWKYDGKKLTNFTTKDGLTSNAVNTIYKDEKGDLWFVTDGEGICKFNGQTFTKFAIK